MLTAEGAKQSSILAAEGERQSRILRAQGERAARYLQAQGQAKAIEKVFAAVKAGKPTPELLAYQYLQTLPQMAQGDANKVWMIPSDFSKSLEGFARMLQRGEGKLSAEDRAEFLSRILEAAGQMGEIIDGISRPQP